VNDAPAGQVNLLELLLLNVPVEIVGIAVGRKGLAITHEDSASLHLLSLDLKWIRIDFDLPVIHDLLDLGHSLHL